MSLLQVTAQKSKDAVGQEGIFSGQVRVDSGTPQGTGTMEYAEGPIQTYDGDWDDGFWHGQGSCALKNGDTYKGEFVSHERHGNGEYTVSFYFLYSTLIYDLRRSPNLNEIGSVKLFYF